MRDPVVVVGGGLAGSSVALHLARKGVSVRLIEKEQVAHHKLCGEFLSSTTAGFLFEAGVDLSALKAEKIHQLRVFNERGQSLSTGLPEGGFGLSRKTLDAHLLALAEREGVQLIFGEKVSDVQSDSSKNFLIKTHSKRTQGDSSSVCCYGSAVFWATGKHDVAVIQRRTGHENASVGFKMHFRLPKALVHSLKEKIELHLYSGGYAGISLVENEVVNFCCVVDKKKFRQLGSWSNLLRFQATENPRLNQIFSQAQGLWSKPLSVANIPYGFLGDQPVNHSFFFLGDQKAVIPSLAGEGMAIALLSAKLSAEAYLEEETLEEALLRYHQKMDAAVRGPLALSRHLHLLLRSRWPSWVIPLLSPFPGLVRHLIRKTRTIDAHSFQGQSQVEYLSNEIR